MRAIVLVKQVPDVRSAPVGIRPDGTIDRRGSTPITNPADLHAIEAALQLCDEVVALSMGPAAADSTLREAISLGVDRLFVELWHHAMPEDDPRLIADLIRPKEGSAAAK